MTDPFETLVAPVLAEAAAREVIALIVGRVRDPRLRWSKDGRKVQVQGRVVFPHLPEPIRVPRDELHSPYDHAGIAARRLRKRAERDQKVLVGLLRKEIRDRLPGWGWERIGGEWWTAPPEEEGT